MWASPALPFHSQKFSNFPRVDDVLPHPGLPRSTTTARRRQPAATAATEGVAGSPTPPPPSEETSTGGAARARAPPLRPRSDDLDTGLPATAATGGPRHRPRRRPLRRSISSLLPALSLPSSSSSLLSTELCSLGACGNACVSNFKFLNTTRHPNDV